MILDQMYINLIFIFAVTILTGETVINSSIPNDLDLPNIIPVHYNIKLISFIESDFNTIKPSNIRKEYNNFLFHGESSITINILHSTQSISLHSLVTTNSVELVKSDGITYKPEEYMLNSKNRLKLRFSDALLPGFYIFKINFIGLATDDNTEDFFRSSYINDDENMLLFATYIQTEARRVFPCWDVPQLRATFAISIMHHQNFRALSNMPIRVQKTNNNITWTQFHNTPPLATHQVAIAVTNFARIRITKNISLWCAKYSRPSLKFVSQIIKNITLHLVSEFDRIRIPKMDHIAIPNFLHNGTSKWGLIFHRESDLIYDEKLDPGMRIIEIARCIASKIAYQWFGNAISPSWWSSFWLHDGLATLYGEEAIVKIFNYSGIMDLFIVQNQYESLHLDSHFNMNPPEINNLSEIDSIFSFPRYIKVLIVLRMLRNAITNQVFRKGVHTYLYKNMFTSVAFDDFWSVQKDLANIYEYDISDEFLAWTVYRHYPILSWTEKNSSYGKMAQNFNTSSYGEWWIPISLMTKSLVSGIIKMLLTPHEPYQHMYYAIENDWIMVDIQQAGYYRVNYDSENWYRIANYLNAGEYETISVINRAKIIDDAFHLMITRQLNVSIFWDLTKYLWQETDYVAWYPMIKVIAYMSSIFPFSRDDISFVDDIKGKLRELLYVPLITLGFEESPIENDLTKYLRQEMAKWACMLEHNQCLIVARRKLYQHLKNPEEYKILPGWKEWTYCNGLKIMNNSMLSNVANMWLRNSEYNLLSFLACSQNSFIIWNYLPYNMLFNQFKQYEIQDTIFTRSYINTFHSFIAKHANNDFILEYILFNFEKIRSKEINTITFLTFIINHVYSERLLDKILHQLEKQKYIEEEHISKINYKIKTRLSQIKNQVDHFQFLNPLI